MTEPSQTEPQSAGDHFRLQSAVSSVAGGSPAPEPDAVASLIRELMDDAAASVAFFSPDFRCQAANKRLAEMTGVPSEKYIGRPVDELAPAFNVTARQALQEVVSTRKPILERELNADTVSEAGRLRYWSASWYPMYGSDGRLMGVTCVLSDKRKRTGEALRICQTMLDLAQAAAGVGSWAWNPQTNDVLCSPGYGPLYGLPPSDHAPPPEKWLELVHPDDRARVWEEIGRAIEGADDVSSEFRVVWPDGSIHWLYSRGRAVRDGPGHLTRVLGVDMDITERKHREEALKESEERFRNMADDAPSMIFASGSNKLGAFFNKSWLSFTGHTLEQELGQGWVAGVHPEDRDRTLAAISASFDARSYCHIEYRLRRADGEYRWVVCNGVPQFQPNGAFAGYIGCATDITDLRRTYEDALARQKLESLGILASGVAHDFNNLLSSILADSEMLQSEIAAGAPAREAVDRISLVATRAAEIVRELMAYAGHESSAFQPVDLCALVAEMLQLLKVSISKRAVLKTDLPTNLPAVAGNPARLRQVMMNLIMNASESLVAGEGVISLAIGQVRVGPGVALGGGGTLPPGDYIRVEVSDTGSGMPVDVRARVFDPFFTTKLAGRGLGLAAVQGIIRSHGGAIEVVSSQGKGSTFRILLPCGGGAGTETRT